MVQLFEKAIIGMALLRFFSGSLEIFAAALILKFNDVEKALIVNSTLAFVGPLILIATTAIGLLGLSDRISFQKMIGSFVVLRVFYMA